MQDKISSQYNQAVLLIKSAILQNQLEAARAVNRQVLALYYGVGKYVSDNTRKGVWGAGAIETISEQHRGELPELRGFSPTSIKKMCQFYEQWCNIVNRPPMADDFIGKISLLWVFLIMTRYCPRQRLIAKWLSLLFLCTKLILQSGEGFVYNYDTRLKKELAGRLTKIRILHPLQLIFISSAQCWNLRLQALDGRTKLADGHPKPADVHPKAANGDFWWLVLERLFASLVKSFGFFDEVIWLLCWSH